MARTIWIGAAPVFASRYPAGIASASVMNLGPVRALTLFGHAAITIAFAMKHLGGGVDPHHAFRG